MDTVRKITFDWHGFIQIRSVDKVNQSDLMVPLHLLLRGTGVSDDLRLQGNEESLSVTTLRFTPRARRMDEAPGTYYRCGGCMICTPDWIPNAVRAVAERSAAAAVRPLALQFEALRVLLASTLLKKKRKRSRVSR